MDNFQTCLRICGKEGHGFRQEAVDISCMGPGLRIKFKPQQFYQYLTQARSRAFTEETVIGTALQVRAGVLDPEITGVEVEEFGLDEVWQASLSRFTCEIRASAAASLP